MISPETTPGATQVTQTALPTGRTRDAQWLRVWHLIIQNRKAAVGLFIVLVFVVIGLIGPYVAPYDPTQMGAGLPGDSPSSQHWLGTTRVGQDIFSQLLVGTRGSLIVGFGAGFLTTLIAVIVGLTAGYLGGWIDDVLTVVANVFLTLPFIPIMIVVASYAAAFNVKGSVILIAVLTLTGWAWGARVKRSQVLTLRDKDFVMAARVAGERWWRIVFVEIVPNMLSLIAASFLFSTVYAILGEAALEFIGLGDPSSVTWGIMLNQAETNSALLTGAWFWFLPPGLCIGVFALGLTLVNYAIDEVTNPKLRVLKVPATGATLPPATEAQGALATGTKTDAGIT
ncbi:MAG: ABC transporter permease [Chloroflexota bacterium]